MDSNKNDFLTEIPLTVRVRTTTKLTDEQIKTMSTLLSTLAQEMVVNTVYNMALQEKAKKGNA